MLNQYRVIFGKNSDGFILPIKININFSFDPKFGYTFIGITEKLSQMSLFLDETNKFKTSDFVFLITNLDGVIYDISESFLKLVNMTLEEWEDYEELKGSKIKV